MATAAPNGTFTVTTIAGCGVKGSKNGPPLEAQLDCPNTIAVGPDGAVYFCEEGKDDIKVIRDGEISTIIVNPAEDCADGPALKAILQQPQGVAVASDGTIFVSDYFNNYIRKIKDGVMTTIAGRGTKGFSDGAARHAQLHSPVGIAIGPDESLYIADTSNNKIRMLKQGQVTTVAGHEGVTCDQLNFPVGVAVDSNRTIYISDCNNGRICVLEHGKLTAVAGGDGRLCSPVGIALGPNGILYIADLGTNSVLELHNDQLTTIAGPGTEVELNAAQAIAVGPDGAVYIADGGNNRIIVLRKNQSKPVE